MTAWTPRLGPLGSPALEGEPEVLLARVQARAASGEVHEIKARFSVNPLSYYTEPYRPVLPEDQVVHVDTTDLDALDVGDVASAVRARLAERRSGAALGPQA